MMTRYDFEIRAGIVTELPDLLRIETNAAKRFDEIESLRGRVDDLTPTDELAAAISDKRLWVADAGPAGLVGFAFVTTTNDRAHLEEISVLPEFGRRGIATALVEHIRAWARGGGLRTLSLTTFTTVPWNEPWYLRLGFHRASDEELVGFLENARAEESRRGLPMKHRVAMVANLS